MDKVTKTIIEEGVNVGNFELYLSFCTNVQVGIELIWTPIVLSIFLKSTLRTWRTWIARKWRRLRGEGVWLSGTLFLTNKPSNGKVNWRNSWPSTQRWKVTSLVAPVSAWYPIDNGLRVTWRRQAVLPALVRSLEYWFEFSMRLIGAWSHSWTKPQVQARSHPNVLAATVWLNNLYTISSEKRGSTLEGVDLSVPLTYADRFRIRKPGVSWDLHPPHVDGMSIFFWGIYRANRS